MTVTQDTIASDSQEKVDYYAEDESIAQSKDEYKSKGKAKGNAKWLGELKQEPELELGDAILRNEFKEIAYGKSPSGSGLRKQPTGNKQRLFHDLCASPNKSISIGGLVLGETDLIDCHNKAVERLAKYVEKKYGSYRQRGIVGHDRHGDRAVVHNGKMLFAALNHYTARPVLQDGEIAIDPQMHTHLLAMNTTKGKDGKWRSLFHETLSQDNSLSFIYNQFLAEEVQGSGFAIRQAEHGFELADITDQQIDVFSKRTRQAEEALKAAGENLDGGNIHRKVRELRRKKVGNITLSDLEELWKPQAEGMSVTRGEGVVPLSHGSADEELQYAINHQSERCVKFRECDLKHFTFKFVQGFSVDDYDQAIAQHPELIPLDRNTYTTPHLLKVELDILNRWKEGLDKVESLVSEISLDQLKQVRGHNNNGEPIALNDDQATAVKGALESRHQFQAIKGLAGVGKTTAMAELLAQVEASGKEIELFGFAATHEAKSELEKSLALKSRTVASLVTSGAEGKVWVVDEAGMNSNREWQDVLSKAQEQGVRVLFVGDEGQNSPVEAGSPFASVVNKYPESVQRMSKIIRQRDEKQLRAVELISAGKGAAALKLLASEGKVRQVKGRNARANAVAKAFTDLPAKEQRRTILVSGTNAERQAITSAVRERLKEQNVLSDSVEIQKLASRNLSKQEAKLGRNYQPGDYVRFHRTPASSYLKSGELYRVNKADGDKLHIQTEGGQNRILDLKQFGGQVEALRASKMEVAVGDRIKFTTTIKAKDWYNGAQMDVTAVSGEWIEAVDKEGKTHRIDTLLPVGIDYDWVGTSYSRQGKTAYRSIVSLTLDPTSSRESATVSISRQTHDIQVFAEDITALHQWVQRSNRQPNLLEDLGNSDRMMMAMERAIENFEQQGGLARDHVEKELTILDLESRLEEIALYQQILEKNHGRTRENLEPDFGRNSGIARTGERRPERVDGRIDEKARGRESLRQDEYKPGITHQSGKPFDWETGSGISKSRPDPAVSPSNPSEIGQSDLEHIAKRLIEIATEKRLEKPLEQLRSQLARLSEITAEVDQKHAAIADQLQSLKSAGVLLQSNKPKPAPLTPFWQPEYNDSDRPHNLCQHHWEEMKASGIHPGLIRLNIESISGRDVIQRLLEDEFLKPHYGVGRTTRKTRKEQEYQCLTEGGWWGKAGTDAKSLLSDRPIPSTNGAFKGDAGNQRIDRQKSIDGNTKYIRYENPLGRDRPVFLANIPDDLAEKIYEKHGVQPSQEDRDKGFWHIVRKENLPIVLIEGQKKTLAALSQGVIAIGTPGVAMYRANEKNADGQTLKLPKRELLDEIKVFATPRREITMAFDQDDPSKNRTVWNVRRDLVRSSELLSESGSIVKVAKWNHEQGKGVDDLIVQSGAVEFQKALLNATSWEAEAKIWYKAQFNSLKKEAVKNHPNASASRIDLEIYAGAIKNGDRDDGLRFLQVSNQSTSYLKAIVSFYPNYLKLKEKPELEALLTQAISRNFAVKDNENTQVLMR